MRRIPGSHSPNVKNRSSKHLSVFTKIRPILRCINTKQLEQLANNNVSGAHSELKRRTDKRAKKELKN